VPDEAQKPDVGQKPDEVQQSDARAADRLIFFSDAVVAIAITLLALDLPVPAGKTAQMFWHSVRLDRLHYLAFLVSFLAISVAWSRHHDAFRYLGRVDPRLRMLNMGWLLMMILNPFATKLLTTQGHDVLAVHAVQFGFYALLQALAAATMLVMIHHMMSAHPRGLGNLGADPRLRAVDPGLLPHQERLDRLDRGATVDGPVQADQGPPPQGEVTTAAPNPRRQGPRCSAAPGPRRAPAPDRPGGRRHRAR
jgi:uncharacterized membrane protein